MPDPARRDRSASERRVDSVRTDQDAGDRSGAVREARDDTVRRFVDALEPLPIFDTDATSDGVILQRAVEIERHITG